jgi:hypothetical protein
MKHLFALLVLLLAPACFAPGGGPGFVGFSTVSGDGDARTDGTVFVAMGELDGEAGIFLKGSGFPLTYPLALKKGEWAATSRSLNLQEHGVLGVDPLPFWTASLFRPGEIDTLSKRLAATITFRPPQP